MTNRIRIIVSAAAVLAATFVGAISASPAHAEDRRPCVSQAEYQSTPGALRYRGAANLPSLNRTKLEERWDVVGLGVIDREVSNDSVTLWMYRACGYSFEEGQVWAISEGRNGPVTLVSRWIAPGAQSSGYTRAG